MCRSLDGHIIFTITAALASTLVACSEGDCTEPDPTGVAEQGESCVTRADCLEGLMCIGGSFEENATCEPFSELPGEVDPGCVAHATDWEHHEADGVLPPSTDAEGCRLLTFQSACNCTGDGPDAGCHPTFPLSRQETWRSCNGCCYRLSAFWSEPEACD